MKFATSHNFSVRLLGELSSSYDSSVDRTNWDERWDMIRYFARSQMGTQNMAAGEMIFGYTLYTIGWLECILYG